jgi:hypothetical protein
MFIGSSNYKCCRKGASYLRTLSNSIVTSRTHRERRLLKFTNEELFKIVSGVNSYQNFVPVSNRPLFPRIVVDIFCIDLTVDISISDIFVISTHRKVIISIPFI